MDVEAIHKLSQSLSALLSGDSNTDDVVEQISSIDCIKSIFSLAEQRDYRFKDALISFRDNGQYGDISIQNVAGGNIYHTHLHINLSEHLHQGNYLTISLRAELRQLEIQATRFGSYCPPYIQNEIKRLKRLLSNKGNNHAM